MKITLWFPNLIENRLLVFQAAQSFTRIGGELFRVAGFLCDYSQMPTDPFRAVFDLELSPDPPPTAIKQRPDDLFTGAMSPWPEGRVRLR